MDQRKQAYLAAMGIELWKQRDVPYVGASVMDASQDQIDQAPVEGVAVLQANRDAGIDIVSTPRAPVRQSDQPVDTELHVPDRDRVASYDWDPLAAMVRQCIACDLHRTRKNTVFGVGNRQADWMIIGEAPGADEDRQGEPFVGRAGQLLNNMLLAIGLKREQVYIANILKCRPPNNRDPRPEEVVKCEPFLKRQVELVNPKIILAVGRIAAHNLLKTDTSLARLRGKRFYYGNQETPVIVTYHPAYLLRSPGDKRKAWQDLLFARSVVEDSVN